MRPISLCMILKNEEKNLEACLKGLKQEVNEIVLVDTGSSDKTPQIASSLATHFHQITWRDDFAWARNEALNLATQPWVLSLDADHRLDTVFWKNIDRLLEQPKAEAYAFLSRNYFTAQDAIENSPDAQAIDESAPSFVKEKAYDFYIDNFQPFFLKNHLDIHWEGIVHETFLPSARRLGHRVSKERLVVHHLGYDTNVSLSKEQNYLKLLLKKCEQEPLNHRGWYELALSFHKLKQPRESMLSLRKALALQPQWPEAQRFLSLFLLEQGDFIGAKSEILKWMQMSEDSFEAQCHLSTALLFLRDEKALLELTQELMIHDACPDFVFSNLGTWYFEKNDYKQSQKYFEKASAINPQKIFYKESLQKIKEKL